MADENPFDALGLKRETLQHLHRQGQLKAYLKDCYRISQRHLHPDTGSGSTDLSAMVNAAYSQIRRHPEQMQHWLQTMQNGHSEYEAVIAGLVDKVGQLQEVEKENEDLRVKLAEALAGNWKGKEEVRTPRVARRARGRKERERTAEPPKEPEPRTPPKPIELHELVLYDAKGKPFRKYDKVTFAGEALRTAAGAYITKTQKEWIDYYRSRKEKLPSLPLLYAIIERLHDQEHPAAAGLWKEFKESSMATSTRIDYAHDKITHDYDSLAPGELRCAIPEGEHWLKDIKREREWKTALQALLMPQDVDKCIKTLDGFSGVPSYIWTPSYREEYPLRAAFVNAYPDRFILGCSDFLGFRGCSRPVAL